MRWAFFFLAGFLSAPNDPPPPGLGPESPVPRLSELLRDEDRTSELPCLLPGAGRGRLPRSSASLTTIRKFMNSCPFISAMARSPPSRVSISTKPKHLLWPVSRSVTILALRTGPMAPNHSNKSDSTASRLSFATKSFIDGVQQRCGNLKEFTSGFLRQDGYFFESTNRTKGCQNLEDVINIGCSVFIQIGFAVGCAAEISQQQQDVCHCDLTILVQILGTSRCNFT